MSAVAEDVQTSEQEQDLFGNVPAARANCTLAFTGVLTHKPEVAMKQLGDGHFVPALVLELDDCGAGHHRVVAHVPFPPEQREQADAKARSLRRGQRVTVITNLTDMRLLLPAASLSTTDTP